MGGGGKGKRPSGSRPYDRDFFGLLRVQPFQVDVVSIVSAVIIVVVYNIRNTSHDAFLVYVLTCKIMYLLMKRVEETI